MADDLDGLGTVELFPTMPNWVNEPTTNLVVGRYYQVQPGSSHIISELTPDIPNIVALGFLLEDKAAEYSFLDFFHSRLGRLERFWLKDPKQGFILKETATLGSSAMKCYPNAAEDIMRGDERIYIEMVDGDILTRELTNVEYSSADDATVLSLNTPLDRDITLTNHIIIGRLLLVRMEYDTLEITAQSNVVSESNITFRELVKEYNDV